MVAFTAFLGSTLPNISFNQILVFDRILTNVGNAYYKTDGKFKAPSQGHYLFTWNLFTTFTHGIGARLVQNELFRASSYAKHVSNNTYYNAHGSVILSLAAGDDVFFRCNEAGGELSAGKSTFTGMKII